MFNSANCLIYLRGNLLEIYRKGNPEPAGLELSPSVIQHMEIQNPLILEKFLNKFLDELGLQKQSAIILLSPDYFFEKTIETTEGEDTEAIVNLFF